MREVSLSKPAEAQAEGKRASQASARDRKIATAALMLAEKGEWPSPEAVAQQTGISEPVVGRRKALLTEGRRLWVKLVGHDHPQWKDPAKQGKVGEAPQRVNQSSRTKLQDPEKTSRIIRNNRRAIRELTATVQDRNELIRRMNLGVRPAEIHQLLVAGAKKKDAAHAKPSASK